jgi:hypothetical protein
MVCGGNMINLRLRILKFLVAKLVKGYHLAKNPLRKKKEIEEKGERP